MSASEEQRAEWLDSEFWERLDRLEGRHQKIQSEHESARRGLDGLTLREAEELRIAWRRYCQVIDELDKTTPVAQREFCLEFAWVDQEYRIAVRRLAQFCSEHRDTTGARWRANPA